MPRPTLVTPDIDYPDSDGQPMAETDVQRNVMTYAIEALKIRFQDCEDVYVSGDLFIYYEEGNRAAAVAPDVFVVFGAANRLRRTYLLWQEGKAPDFVMEVTLNSPGRMTQDAKASCMRGRGYRNTGSTAPRVMCLLRPCKASRFRTGGMAGISSWNGWALFGACTARCPV